MAKKVVGYIKLQIPAGKRALPEFLPGDFCSQWFSQYWLLLYSHILNKYALHTSLQVL